MDSYSTGLLWLFLFPRIMFSKFIYVVPCSKHVFLFLSNIPLYKYTTLCLSFHQLLYIGLFPRFWLLWPLYTSFDVDMCFQFSGSGIAGSSSNYVNFLKNCRPVFQSGHTVSTSSKLRIPIFSHPCQHLLLPVFLILAILVDTKWYLIMVLICISQCCYTLKHFVKKAKNKNLLFSKSILVTRKGSNLGTTNLST